MAATLANVNRGRNTPAFKHTDFMPWHEAPAEEAGQETEDERDSIFRMMGGS